MCGIVSYFSTARNYDRKIEKFLRDAVLTDSVRGMHSTGLFFGNDKFVDTYKKAVPGSDFIDLPHAARVFSKHNAMNFIVAHNRAATKGAVNAVNAHPFNHGDITGVHNGTLNTYLSLAPKMNFDTDSEHIFYALNDRENVNDVIKDLNGAFTLIWHNRSDNTVHLIRNDDRPYALGFVKGSDTILGASEAGMLRWLAGRHGIELEKVVEPKPYVEHVFDFSDLKSPKTFEREEYSPPYSATSGYGHGGYDYGGYDWDDKKDTMTGTVQEMLPIYFESFGKAKGRDPKKIRGTWVFTNDESTETFKLHNVANEDIDPNLWYKGTVGHVCHSYGKKYRNIRQNTIEVLLIEQGDDDIEETDPDSAKCSGCEQVFPKKDLKTHDNAYICEDCIEAYGVTPDEDEEPTTTLVVVH